VVRALPKLLKKTIKLPINGANRAIMQLEGLAEFLNAMIVETARGKNLFA